MGAKLKAISILLLAGVIGSISSAQEIGESEIDDFSLADFLNMKVTTASKKEQDIRYAPATIRVLTEKEIKARGYKDLKDIFRDLPGFDVSEDLSGEVRTLATSRGILGANKIMILRDGKMLNSTVGEDIILGNNISLFDVKEIEIMYGPGSVLYGADAYAGVINLKTKSINDLKEKGHSAIVDIAYGTENHVDVSLLTGAEFNDKINTTFGARFYSSDGYDPTHFSEFNDYNQIYSYSQPVRDYEIYSKTELGQGRLSFYRQDAREPGGASSSIAGHEFTKDYVWHQIQNKLFFEHEISEGPWTLKSTIGWESYELDPETNFRLIIGGEPTPLYKYAKHSATFIEEQLDYTWNQNTSMVAGFSVESVNPFSKSNDYSSPFNRDNLVDEITYPPSGSGLPPEYAGQTLRFGVKPYTSSGIFSELTHKFSDQWVGNLGLRYDYNSEYYGVWNPRAGLIYSPREETNIKFLYGQAYIKPPHHLAYQHWNAGTYGYYPNPDLEPEEIETLQINMTNSFSPNLVMSLNLYYNAITNLITPINDMWSHYGNRGEPTSQGFEFTVDHQYENFRSYLYYSFVDAKQDSGADMNKVAKNKITAGTSFVTMGWLSISPRLRWSDEITILSGTASDGVEKIEGHFLVDLSLRTTNLFNQADLYLTARNIFDEQYYSASPFGEGPDNWLQEKAPQPGRTAEVGFTYKF